MSQTAITQAFEQWKAQQGATGESILLDEFVFANVPGLDPSLPVDRSEQMPPAEQIVYRQLVSRKGVVNENAVVHSVVLGADVGDFSFNWIGLINKATGTLAMIVHAPEQQKLKTSEGQQGNVLTRSFLMEYNGAQAETGINTPAETWQIDFTARMSGMDERQRLENIDIYGAASFFDDGWLVNKAGSQYFVTRGIGYVAGLRADLAENKNITVTAKPVKVWMDVSWSGTLTSTWAVTANVVVAEALTDYVQSGVKHYVFALAEIDENGNITDLRPKGNLSEQQANNDFLRKNANLSDITDVSEAIKNLSLDEFITLAKNALSRSGGEVDGDVVIKGILSLIGHELVVEKDSGFSGIHIKNKSSENGSACGVDFSFGGAIMSSIIGGIMANGANYLDVALSSAGNISDRRVNALTLNGDIRQMIFQNGWELQGYTKNADFTQLMADAGWVRFPNGIILQWFWGNTDSTGWSAGGFPIGWPARCFGLLASNVASTAPASAIAGVKRLDDRNMQVTLMERTGALVSKPFFCVGIGC
ncbi:phage tail protein [Citrobacter sp. CFNIH10]|uniref:phage tail-collar fiber domain-containing protein n=1 Tax=Citrobacter sp. CFNIH10 TaxID=1920110 RepID=UPI000CECBB74|nr:phage tail protein [Citrobacter sp. CFNIH10]AUZ65669.1 hypothetical protein C2U53_18550 [Citrobacter sp. CFNIH10]